ncbi:MAG: hypothetical protein NOF05_15785 [Candidatus Accumulibacter phosphatis]|uniref:Uncharacterized protein n=1 Tax=Candidatus Accumulibacter cognatus TaxID=2954383 RepID=A0A080M0R0_9PROT|nr:MULTISPECIES: hypothetical protein [Candidatus Accumulibacter]MCQ1550236.1 hypothetical protein [Candidatus Accumulibacter phosphatis]KFB74852.1 MAG: hypothetical protein AW06_004197 [Candidatus Accumulibacter cognatus]MBN8518088.1 hypothetical protein [Accumulibacter sp.]MBO3711461.1 hypothetical protein [Accumulibacter sp.]MCM8580663.1 hypothetical protein [Accumulibacter sp.]
MVGAQHAAPLLLDEAQSRVRRRLLRALTRRLILTSRNALDAWCPSRALPPEETPGPTIGYP